MRANPPRLRASVCAAAAVLAVIALSAVPALSARSAVGPFSTAPSTAALPSLKLPTVISHVIVVMEENHDLSWTLTDPTFKSLYNANAHAKSAYAVCHPSAPNYLGFTSATKTQCGSDGVSSYGLSNLGSDLASHNDSWQGLMESMPSACDHSDAYPYIAHHNPWIYYSKLKTPCPSDDLAFFTSTGTSRLASEIKAGTLPTFTFVSPNMLHDAHDGTLAAASSWVSKYVLSPVHASTVYAPNTAIFVTFDEGYKQSCACADSSGYTAGGVTLSGGPIYLVAVSPIPPLTLALGGNVTAFNLVHTVEWLLGIPSLGNDDNSSFPAMTGLFK